MNRAPERKIPVFDLRPDGTWGIVWRSVNGLNGEPRDWLKDLETYGGRYGNESLKLYGGE